MPTHLLNDKWTLWAHLPHDTDWSYKSYYKIMTFETMEEILVLYKTIPENMIKNCMLFLMRDGVNPTWEDRKNRNGGCFSYKIPNKNIVQTWVSASYLLVGEYLSENSKISSNVNGITISPKKNFCVVKIWMYNCQHQNPNDIKDVEGLVSAGCLFKKHLQ